MSKQLILDSLFLEFYENRTRIPIYLEKGKIISLVKYFPDYLNSDSPLPYFDIKHFDGNFSNLVITPILELSNGKLSLCGCDVDEITCGKLPNCCVLFFHSCTKQEQQDILDKILKFVDKNNFYDEYDADEDSIEINLEDDVCVYIYLKIYKDTNELILSMEDSFERRCWNQITKYSCTISCGLLTCLGFANDCHPMNLDDYYNLERDMDDILYDNYSFSKKVSNSPDLSYDIQEKINNILCNNYSLLKKITNSIGLSSVIAKEIICIWIEYLIQGVKSRCIQIQP